MRKATLAILVENRYNSFRSAATAFFSASIYDKQRTEQPPRDQKNPKAVPGAIPDLQKVERNYHNRDTTRHLSANCIVFDGY